MPRHAPRSVRALRDKSDKLTCAGLSQQSVSAFTNLSISVARVSPEENKTTGNQLYRAIGTAVNRRSATG